jgi:hypothetical protein
VFSVPPIHTYAFQNFFKKIALTSRNFFAVPIPTKEIEQ